jgi:hypothetical protein
MGNAKRAGRFSDALFWFLMALTLVGGAIQFGHMIRFSTRGLSTSMLLFACLYTVINMMLVISAYRAKPSRMMTQVISVYAAGTLVLSSFILVMLIKGEGVWEGNDNLTTALVISAMVLAIVYSQLRRLPFLDPVMKGLYSLIFRSIPQFLMAWKIFQIGGQGLNAALVVTYHVTTAIRIYQIVFSIREAGWDRNRYGILLFEAGNAVSWTCVTVAWLIS